MIIQWKFVLKVIGIIIVIESLFMFLSAIVAGYYKGNDFFPLLYSGGITFAIGCFLASITGFRKKTVIIGRKESYLSVALSWISFAFAGALPFYISQLTPNFTDAFFESMSGITTTGCSILQNVEIAPKGLLFWRSMMQWLGGMGIIVFSIALLPLIGGGAAQLFDAEVTGLTHDKFRPRVTQMAKRLWIIYLSLTFSVIALLWFPMGGFDAICHGLTTISTGGFSTKQASIAHWNSWYIETIVLIFMLTGAINFTLLYFLFAKGDVKRLRKDEELRWFLYIILGASILITSGLFFNKHIPLLTSLRQSFFQVVSAITTSGFSATDYTQWGAFYSMIFLFLMFVCGCAGSTSGGLKVVRVVVLVKNTIQEFERLIHPRAIIPIRLNGRTLSFGVVQRLLAFAFLYLCIILLSWGILTAMGLPILDSLSAAISAIGNSGMNISPMSLGEISQAAKWYLAFLMVVGRLEVFTILILFSPGFWRR